MNFTNLTYLFNRSLLTVNSLLRRNYAKKDTGAVSMLGGALKKKKGGKLGAVMEKIELPIETDPVKLCTHVCGANIYKTGEEIKLKPDSEYPDWLWNLRLGPPPPLKELEPGSREYWRRIRKLGLQRNNMVLKIKRMKALNPPIKRK